jgi:isopenicillin N synthase-like dioxygenase
VSSQARAPGVLRRKFMAHDSIPSVDLEDYTRDEQSRRRFVEGVGSSLRDVGFFAVRNHAVAPALLEASYAEARAFFALPAANKARYDSKPRQGQRGYTRFGTEQAKDAQVPDLKEFFQIGCTKVPDDHAVHALYGANIWPDQDRPGFRPAMTALYEALDELGATLLEACALFIGERADLFRSMATESDTILRIIHYPPLGGQVQAGAVRAAAHEDINLITLLPGSTADGLEILRRDGSWLPIRAHSEEIVVDSGDMLQAISNGLFRSTTHRVVNPDDRASDRYSLPVFIHPRATVDLTPLSSCIAQTGGSVNFPRQTAGEYLARRLREIGLG